MAYDLLLTTWKDSVRRICGGVSSSDVPDTLLDDDLYAAASEDWIKRKITDWSTVKVTKSKELNRAAIYHVASKVCEYLVKKLFQSEKIFDYSYELQKIDWAQEAINNLGLCYDNMDLAKPGTIVSMTMIDVISRSEPIYEELEVVEE
jgi:hypothetical protein